MAEQVKAKPRAELLQRYQELSSEGQRKFSLGQVSEALKDCDAAIECAKAHGDPELVDRAIVNRIGIALEVDASQSDIVALSKVLLRTSSREVRFLAAYNLAWAYKGRRETERAITYAKRALSVAEDLGRSEWRASALNLLGLAYLSSSYFDEAVECFGAGLSLLPGKREKRYATILDNYGYCLVLQGAHRDGFKALLQSLRTLRRLKERWIETAPLISLCFAYLEIGKVRPALRHGLRALKLAEEMADPSSIKAALYLLGESAKQAGDAFAARRYFQRLQESYFPTAPDLIELLMVVDARTMVNLKA
ncbi:MAG: tetratricopeptide repeat protein [Acidobacteria bacterium]|nr:tetratricopeptide repeat protein [Acidobacteriota bacterium]